MQALSLDILDETITILLSWSIEAKITIMLWASTALKYSVRFLCRDQIKYKMSID